MDHAVESGRAAHRCAEHIALLEVNLEPIEIARRVDAAGEVDGLPERPRDGIGAGGTSIRLGFGDGDGEQAAGFERFDVCAVHDFPPEG
jgi:hypothetical protein